MSIFDTAKEWMWGIALKKGVVSAAKLLVAWAIAHGVSVSFSINGIAIDTTNEAAMAVAINSGLTVLRSFLKIKYPKVFGWM